MHVLSYFDTYTGGGGGGGGGGGLPSPLYPLHSWLHPQINDCVKCVQTLTQ